jgi:hypothetical protein
MMKEAHFRKLLHLAPLLALPVFVPVAPAQQKDGKAIIASACATEYASDRSDHTAFMYKDHDITPGHDTLFAIVETPEGNLKRKLEDHGHPLSPQERGADDARIEALLHNPAQQRKLKQDSAHDDEQADALLNLLPKAFLWTIVGEDGNIVTLRFKPDPNFEPDGMEARVFADMQGEVVVDRAEDRIKSMRGQMVDDVKIAFGLIGRLQKGGTFQVEHREVAPHHWQLTELHVHIAGHILFNFKTIGSQEDEVKTDFKISPAQNFQQAWEILNQPPPKATAALPRPPPK